MERAIPNITVRLVGILRQLVDTEEVQLPLHKNDTIESLLRRLVGKYPILEPELFTKRGQLHSYLNIFINDKSIQQRNLSEVRVKSPATLTILMAIGGG